MHAVLGGDDAAQGCGVDPGRQGEGARRRQCRARRHGAGGGAVKGQVGGEDVIGVPGGAGPAAGEVQPGRGVGGAGRNAVGEVGERPGVTGGDQGLCRLCGQGPCRRVEDARGAGASGGDGAQVGSAVVVQVSGLQNRQCCRAVAAARDLLRCHRVTQGEVLQLLRCVVVQRAGGGVAGEQCGQPVNEAAGDAPAGPVTGAGGVGGAQRHPVVDADEGAGGGGAGLVHKLPAHDHEQVGVAGGGLAVEGVVQASAAGDVGGLGSAAAGEGGGVDVGLVAAVGQEGRSVAASVEHCAAAGGGVVVQDVVEAGAGVEVAADGLGAGGLGGQDTKGHGVRSTAAEGKTPCCRMGDQGTPGEHVALWADCASAVMLRADPPRRACHDASAGDGRTVHGMSDSEVQHHRSRRGQDDILGLHIPVDHAGLVNR
ncbi:hypothetical protein QF032_007928 [Streptomyces achromogenes]|nr:hypothetical protein [Streptomyces achromogenes]